MEPVSRGEHSRLTTKTLLMYGEGRGGAAWFRAVDKATGREVGKVAIPGPGASALNEARSEEGRLCDIHEAIERR
jgi:hypothetical protein